jgi:hypothetical protein
VRPLFQTGEFKIDLVAVPAGNGHDGAQPLQLSGATDTDEVFLSAVSAVCGGTLTVLGGGRVQVFVYAVSGSVDVVTTQNKSTVSLSTGDVFLVSAQHRPFHTSHAPGSVCLLVRIVSRRQQQQVPSSSSSSSTTPS